MSIINVVKSVNLPELLDFQVIDEHPSSNGTHKMIRRANSFTLGTNSTILIDKGMVWRLATPLSEDQQKQDKLLQQCD